MFNYVKELLYLHDCVIIPGLGGFVGNSISSRLDDAKNLIYPPSKKITFNRNLTQDDGLLADYVARVENIGFSEARQKIASFVRETEEQINKELRLEIADFGILYLNQEKRWCFLFDAKSNFLKTSYGLEPVFAKPLKKLEYTEPVVAEKSPKVPESILQVRRMRLSVRQEEIKRKRKRNVAGYAVGSLSTLLITVLFFWASGMIDVKQSQFSSLLRFETSSASSYTPRSGDLMELKEIFETDSFPIFQNGRVLLDEERTLTIVENPVLPVTTYVETKSVQGSYFIIGGCFEFKENAENFVMKLKSKGYDAFILDKNKGLYRVTFGAYPNREHALMALDNIRDNRFEAWMLRKQ
jgi:hypothetical protein